MCLVILFVDELIGSFDVVIGYVVIDLMFELNCMYGVMFVFVIYDVEFVCCCVMMVMIDVGCIVVLYGYGC